MKKQNLVILLTACVNPNGMIHTKLQDPSTRMQHYLDALDFYVNKSDLRIVLVENTLYPMEAQLKKYADTGRLEYLTFNGNDYDRAKGKGYGEGLIIKYAVENSSFVRDADYIIKITGRIIVDNLTALVHNFFLLAKRNRKYVFTGDIIDKGGHLLVRSEFLIVSKAFFVNYFFPRIHLIYDFHNITFERVLVSSLIHWLEDGHKHHLFAFPIFLKGISGGHLVAYAPPSIKDQFETLIRSIVNYCT